MRENRSANSNARINLICGVVALLCVVAMFIPIGRERGHFDQYGEVLVRGEAPYFIDHVIHAPGGENIVPYAIGMLLVFAAGIPLLVWAFSSFKGAPVAGLAASIFNLMLSAFTLLLCLSGAFDGAVTLPVVIGLAALAIAALVLAIVQKKAAN